MWDSVKGMPALASPAKLNTYKFHMKSKKREDYISTKYFYKNIHFD